MKSRSGSRRQEGMGLRSLCALLLVALAGAVPAASESRHGALRRRLNEVELVEDASTTPPEAVNATPAELPICKGGCRELSCAYPRMCKQMVTQYKCRCAECQGCDKKKAPATNNVVGKEHFKRRVVKAPKRR